MRLRINEYASGVFRTCPCLENLTAELWAFPGEPGLRRRRYFPSLVLLCGLYSQLGLSAQVIIDEATGTGTATGNGDVSDAGARGEAGEEKGEKGKKGSQRKQGKKDLPPEYRSGAVPNEPAETQGRFERAENHFARSEWAAGLALLHEILTEISSPEHRGRLRREARLRRMALERAIREKEARAGEEGNPGGGGRRPGRGPDAPQVGDDELTPTVQVYSSDGILHLPVSRAVRKGLSDLPDDARALYDRTYQDPAKIALERALDLPSSEGIPELRRVGEHYPLTAAGRRAWEELGLRLADAGRLLEAASALEERLDLPFEAADSREADVLTMAALYRLMSGHLSSGRRHLRTIARDHSDVAIPVRGVASLGASLKEHELFENLLKVAAELSSPPSSWPSVMGSYNNGQYTLAPEGLPVLGSEARWIYRLKDPDDSGKKSSRRVSHGAYSALQLVTHGPLVYLRRREQVVALDLETGKESWTADPGPRPPQVSTYPYYRSSVQQNLDYTDPGGRALTVYRPKPGAPALIVTVDHSSNVVFQRTGKAQQEPNHLFAHDALSGKLCWKLGGESGDGPNRGRESWRQGRGLAYAAPPTPAGRLLIAPATREGGYYLVGLRATEREARVRWVTRLYSFNVSYFQRYGYQVRHGSTLAALDGVVYAAPGHGLVCGVEAASGRLLWLSRYRSRVQRQRSTVYGFGVHWVQTQPLLIERPEGDLLVVAPQDSDYLTAFDARSGKTLWDHRYSLGSAQVLGVEGDRLFFAGAEVHAVSLATGDEVWKSESIGGAGGHGFVAAGRIYIPARSGTLCVLDTGDGTILEKFKILDPRVSTAEPFNLFPIDGKLLAINGGGVVSLRPQDETWKILEPAGDSLRFRRARLLRGSARFEEALKILYELEDTYREGKLHARIVSDLIQTVSDAVDATKDPRFIEDLLQHHRPIVQKRGQVIAWRLRQASLLEEMAVDATMKIHVELLGEDGINARSPEGNMVDVSIYSSDTLRRLLQAESGEDGNGRGQLSDGLEKFEVLRERDEKTLRALADEISEAACHKLVTRYSHTPSAAKAGALLAALAQRDSHHRIAANHLLRLLGDYPDLRGEKKLEMRIRALENEERHGPTIFRLEDEARIEAPWREVFRRSVDEGVGVASAPGSQLLPSVLIIHEQKLKALDEEGNPFIERELPGFPDVEETKIRLQSHIEEPAVAYLKGERLALFTAAGCYGFTLKPGQDTPIDAGSFRLLWAHTYEHPLERLGPSRSSWGNLRLPGSANAFPEVFFSEEGHPTVLMPSGEFFRINRESGKLIWRFPEGGYQVRGRPRRLGAWYFAQSIAPAGLLRFPADLLATANDQKTGKREVQFIPGPPGSNAGYQVEGIASVHHGKALTVLAETSNRKLWSRSTSSRLVFATPTAVWTSGSGNIKARALRSGRELVKIELPPKTTVVSYFRDRIGSPDTPDSEPSGEMQLTLVTSGGSTVLGHMQSSYYSKTRTGSKLHLVRLDHGMNKHWEKEIASGPVTYDGKRRILEDGRWLFVFNEQEPESEKWYTRVIAVRPENGESELWLETEISGKGTGQPARLAAVAGGLMLGNADGFGWFRRSADVPAKSDAENDDVNRGSE